ncbi:hypothetical protein BXZ70DRAFT_305675 [Cristinia sonorae]|uniref:Uncharacterized protein n=1 Tax=Cristinia sonorae TaxID=1940300 RepID=A0A8K0ULW5_9AGAR|nr:hypothetical protein BXZ70DRAFT_305675 [Cristinia sonorae]
MSYVILGRAIKNEYLALGTLFGTAALALSFSGGSKETPAPAKSTLEAVKDTVKFNAGSSEEEQLYVFNAHLLDWNGLSTTDQGQQYQELHRGGREGVKTLIDVGFCLHGLRVVSPIVFDLATQYHYCPLACQTRLCNVVRMPEMSGSDKDADTIMRI